MLSTDSEGLILTWNTAAEKLTGYRSWEVKGSSFFERCVSEKEELRQVFRNLRVADSPQTGEWELFTKSGTTIPISWVFSAMKDERDRSVGVVAVGRDLSEHRKLEMQLLQSQKLAALGVMAGGIAHEIRNPLAVCSSAAQFLKNPNVKPELREECIGRILAGISKASSIIENLLRFARPSSSTEMAVRGNANLLQQMFLNFFLNAFNAMPQGGRLTVEARRSEDVVHVRIKDTGCGISPEHLEKIFDPFFTLSPV